MPYPPRSTLSYPCAHSRSTCRQADLPLPACSRPISPTQSGSLSFLIHASTSSFLLFIIGLFCPTLYMPSLSLPSPTRARSCPWQPHPFVHSRPTPYAVPHALAHYLSTLSCSPSTHRRSPSTIPTPRIARMCPPVARSSTDPFAPEHKIPQLRGGERRRLNGSKLHFIDRRRDWIILLLSAPMVVPILTPICSRKALVGVCDDSRYVVAAQVSLIFASGYWMLCEHRRTPRSHRLLHIFLQTSSLKEKLFTNSNHL